MPELPEVHSVVTMLQSADILGKRIVASTVSWKRSVSESDGDERGFSNAIIDRVIRRIERRGKLIVMRLDDPWTLTVHLRMSGMLYVVSPDVLPDPYVRFRLKLNDRRNLDFRDPRKFGRCILTRYPSRVLGKLGRDPLSADFTCTTLVEMLSQFNRRLKSLLLDQTVISGLGNIYVDEALWYAQLHPLRLSSTINRAEAAALYKAIQFILHQAIENNGTRLGDGKGNFAVGLHTRRPFNQHYLTVFRKTGQPCIRCGTPIQRIIVAQRSTHICTSCQRLQPRIGPKHRH